MIPRTTSDKRCLQNSLDRFVQTVWTIQNQWETNQYKWQTSTSCAIICYQKTTWFEWRHCSTNSEAQPFPWLSYLTSSRSLWMKWSEIMKPIVQALCCWVLLKMLSIHVFVPLSCWFRCIPSSEYHRLWNSLLSPGHICYLTLLKYALKSLVTMFVMLLYVQRYDPLFLLFFQHVPWAIQKKVVYFPLSLQPFATHQWTSQCYSILTVKIAKYLS